MSSRKKAKAAFVSALVLLLIGGAAAFLSIVHLRGSERLVSHTREVQAAIGEFDSAMTNVGRARMGYVTSGSQSVADQFAIALKDVPLRLQTLRALTPDNPEQQELCSRLEKNTEHRLALSKEAVAVSRSDPDYDDKQAEITQLTIPLLSETSEITEQMRSLEEGLLSEREHVVHRLSLYTYSILLITLALAVAMFIVHYRLLTGELIAREQAEQSSRALSTRLMQLQDEERRKFSRELHDSLGQYLASMKINLDMLSANHLDDSRYTDCLTMLEQSITETRTISYLLHPPLLDHTGLSSAVRWYVDGFAQRSGIQVSSEIPHALGRLPQAVELVLFRVLQESLTNIHRHSKSQKAEIKLKVQSQQATLSVRDYGSGISKDVLERFRNDGTSGVGLAGMRERVRDLGGKFKVASGAFGTTISVSVPLQETKVDGNVRTAD